MMLEDELRKLESDSANMDTWCRALRLLQAGSFLRSELLAVHLRLMALGPLPEGFCGPKRREMASVIEGRVGRKLGKMPGPEKPKPSPTRGSIRRPITHPATPKPAPRSTSDLKAVIKKEVSRREIGAVLHFTRAANLLNIAAHGILPKAQLDRRRIPYTPNDSLRLDHTPDASSVSISWPNWQMFFHYREDEPDETWVVLEILPDVLWEKDCAFCWTNAASGPIRPIPRKQLKCIRAFAEMFVDHDGRPGRSRCNLEPSQPTDPQTEVLVFDQIPVSMIKSIHASHRMPTDLLSSELARLVVVDGGFFGPRHDYAEWKKPPNPDKEGSVG